MATILIAGATGTIGKALISKLKSNHRIHILTRNKSLISLPNYFYWNPEKHEIDLEAFKDVNHVINLSGENIGKKRWTKIQKQKITQSRIDSTQTLVSAINTNNIEISSFINASAVGYYGTASSDYICNEDSPFGTDFLAQTSVKWEDEALRINNKNIRRIIIRTGIVLDKSSGVILELQKSLSYKILPIFGNGNQYMPWIHIDDLCNMYKYCIDNNSISGIYNAVASEHCTNKSFIQTIKKVSPTFAFIFKIPSWFLHIIFGEMASILVSGNKVSNKKIVDSGFTFTFDTLQKAILDLIK